MAVGNAIIFVFHFYDSHWAEEYGLYCGVVLLGVVVACVPLVWKRSRSLAIIEMVLSIPMMWFWVNWIVRLAAFVVGGDT